MYPQTIERLIQMLPARASPTARLEYFMALIEVHRFVTTNPHAVVRVDAPRVRTAALMRGVTLPLASFDWAVHKLSKPI